LKLARVLADENIPFSAVELLEQLGHEVKWVVSAGLQGADDETLHDLAVAEKRIIVSFDDYFGQRAYTCPERPPGIVILKFKPRNASEVRTRLQEAIAEVRDLSGKLVIVQRTIVRVRVLD
jgi:predicted nuclease of predicted toxin-antitoxin system